MRERIEYKGHHHVQKSWAFCKCRTVSELALTPLWRALTKNGFELILGHSPQMLTTRVVKELYPRNSKHTRNKLRCDRNARTSNVSEEKRYWTINLVHVKVKLLDKDRWLGRHTKTPIPDCEWHQEDQCWQSSPEWLGVRNECRV